jgi:hypothetical protein
VSPGVVVSDRFRIEREAGSGGMGAVFRAIDLVSGEPVALKVLRHDDFVDGQRLEREAALLATFGHPGIVKWVAHGTTVTGAPYLAMEWLDGETLAQRLRAGGVSMFDAVRIVRAAADALGVAHARGIVHRDVKPGNLFLVGGDPARVKVLDFGIARRIGQQSLSLTASGNVVGTPYYMSPEQARGQRTIDARTDVWALGCVLYQALAHRPPFDHENLVAVLAAILLEQPAAISELRSGVPADLELLVATLLSKDPAERPADGAALVRALDALGPVPGALSSPAAAAQRVLTEREQRVVCLVLVERGVGMRADAATVRDSGAEGAEGRVRAAADAHGGRVEVLADGSLVVAVGEGGAPTDQAARAARCALALRAILPEPAIAIAAGRATFRGRMPVGDVLDSGARLLGLPAAPDASRAQPATGSKGIRVDDALASLLDARFDVDRDEHGRVLRGLAREADTGRARTLLGKATPCVGRDRELATLEAIYDECAGEPIARVAVVTSPAGGGKSRLLAELLARLEKRRDPPIVLSARGDPLAGGSPFWLLAQALRGACRIADGEPIEVRRAKLLARIGARFGSKEAGEAAAAMLGELARVPFPDEHDEVLRAARRDPQLRGDRMRRALEDFLEAETSSSPVVVALDDLHLGDRPSLAFVDAALRHLASRPLFVIGLGRPEIGDLFPDLFADRDPQSILLGRLTPRAARSLVAAVLGDGVPAETVERLVERADGNPFFLEELVRVMGEGRGADLPESVLAMIEARLASLDAETRRVLRAASILGARAPRGAILALLGAEGRPAPIDERLRELADRELLLVREPGEHAFRSALVREAAYAMTTDEDRRVGHALAGEWLEAAGETDPVVLAEHFERGGRADRAAAQWARAAGRALDGDDLDTALARAERGLDARPAPAVQAELLLAKAAVKRWRGEYGAALQAAREASLIAAPGSVTSFEATSIVVSAAGQLGQHGEIDRALDGALAPAEPGAGGAQVVALCRAAAQLLGRDRSRAESLVARAEASAARGADALGSAWIEVLHASFAMRDGDVAEFVARTEAAAHFYERAGDARDACNQRVRLANGWMSLGEAARAEPVLRAALADAERIGLPLVAGYALQNLGHTLAVTGRPLEGRECERRAIEIAKKLGHGALEAGARLYLSDMALEAGDSEGAEREARAARELLPASSGLRLVALASQARAVSSRDPVRALELAKDAAEGLASHAGLEEGEARIRLALAEALAGAGDVRGARAVAAAAAEALASRAAKISAPELRDGFLTRVPEHRRIRELAVEHP